MYRFFCIPPQVQARKDKESCEKHEKESPQLAKKDIKQKLGRTDIEDEDDQESYFKCDFFSNLIFLEINLRLNFYHISDG